MPLKVENEAFAESSSDTMPKNSLMLMHMKHHLLVLVGLAAALLYETTLLAQQSPVYVDDSPVAWEMFREAQDQAEENVGEAVRLYQDLLDGFAMRLIQGDSDLAHLYQATRLRVLRELVSDNRPGGLLERHRIMERAEAQRLHAAGEFERLVLTRPWTQPGLDALLRVAQQALEAARFDAACAHLDLAVRHPDLHATDRAAAFVWYLRGVAARYTSDVVSLDRSRSELQQLIDAGDRHASALQAQLQQLLDEPAPVIARSISPLDVGTVSPNVTLQELVAEEIWSVPLPETLYSRRFNQSAGRAQVRRGREQVVEDRLLMTAAPSVVSSANGGVVYINQGHHIMALDRFTGSPMWPMAGGYVERPPLTIIDRDDDHARDINVIVVEHDSLVTLTGHAHASGRSNEGSVLCLNADTGELRWTTRLDRLSEQGLETGEDEGLFPHSAPIIAEGRVFVLARKISPQSLMSTYLVSLNLHDGSLQWIRHIASSGSIRRAARSFSTLVYDDGDVYLNTAVGAVARVNADSGQVRWLHRVAVPLNPTSAEQTRRPWELDAPVLTPNYVINLLPGIPGSASMAGGPRVLVLDRYSGHEIVAYDAAQAGWNSPAYLLSPGSDSSWFFAVGREIRAFHIDAIDAPAWSLSEDSHGTPLQIAGRVHVVSASSAHGTTALVVPTHHAVLIVDATSGQIINRLDLASLPGSISTGDFSASDGLASRSAGNPVVVDSQLFIADDEQIRSYMAVTHAVGMLLERIEAEPAEADPAMALLRLAIAAAQSGASTVQQDADFGFELITTATDAVLRSVKLAATSEDAHMVQSRLFDMLREIDVDAVAKSSEQAEEVFALQAKVIDAGKQLQQPAVIDAQTVDRLLAYGDWLSQRDGREEDAIEAYRAVLTQGHLAEVRRRENDVVRPGRDWAQRRLASMGHAEDQRASLAGVFKHRPSSVVLGPQQGPAALIEGAIVPVNREIHGAGFGDSDARSRSEIVLVQGSSLCLHETHQSRDDVLLAQRWQKDIAGLYDAAASVARTNENMQPSQIWHLPNDQLLVWLEFAAEQRRSGRFALIDGIAGRARWTSPEVQSLFGDVNLQTRRNSRAEQRSRAGNTPRRGGASIGADSLAGEPPFVASELLPLVSEQAAYVVRRDGRVVKFAIEDGQSPVWMAKSTLDEVHHAALADGMLVLAGVVSSSVPSSGAGRQSEVYLPAVAAFDTESGLSVLDDEQLILVDGAVGTDDDASGDDRVRWLHLDQGGMLVCATSDAVHAWDIKEAQFLWTNRSSLAQDSSRGWVIDERIYLQTADGEVCSISLDDARISALLNEGEQMTAAGVGGRISAWGPVQDVRSQRQSVDHRVLVHYPQRIAWYDADGQRSGIDMIQDERNYRWVLPATDRVVLISAHQPRQQPVPGGSSGARRTHHVYSIYVLSTNGRLLEQPIQVPALYEPIRHAELIDGWLLMSTSAHTIAVPFPADG